MTASLRRSVARTRSGGAVQAGLAVAGLSRRLGRGSGSIIGGRVTLALHPGALRTLATGRQVVLVSGTNGKTTTSHLTAAALRTLGPVAHNATGSNMPDGAVAALAQDRDARLAVIEVDELHLATVAAAVRPAVIVLLNLSRDQLDRGTEVRAVAAALAQALARSPATTVVANADDPMVVWAASAAQHVVWVSAGSGWTHDTMTCPRCGQRFDATTTSSWECGCGLAHPTPNWRIHDDAALPATGVPIPVPLHADSGEMAHRVRRFWRTCSGRLDAGGGARGSERQRRFGCRVTSFGSCGC